MKYKVRQAYGFYKRYVFNKELQKLLRKYNRHVAGSVPPVYWEVFGGILTGDKGKFGYGSDFEHYEIKSSVQGASFEYQYHLNGGVRKLKEDPQVDHLFISYSPDYKDIDVRVVKGTDLGEKFKSWMPALKANYNGPNRQQRFRRSIAFGTVRQLGEVIMSVRQGELVKIPAKK